ncbi:DoxX family protein [Streptacidiphilus sp. 4-A2]|nr:DoxX family protein [Streptacidiphilus sp. 4-A2]
MLSATAQLAGSAALVLGWRTRWGAALLLAFIVPATLLFHLRSDQTDVELFTRDLAIAGGLILLIQQGPGALSVDARTMARAEAAGPPPAEAASARS